MTKKLVAAAAAVALSIGTLSITHSAVAATPTSEQACAASSCSAAFAKPNQVVTPGQQVTSKIQVKQGTSLSVAAFVVRFELGKDSSPDTGTTITQIVEKVSADAKVDYAKGGKDVTFTITKDAPGGKLIVAPSDIKGDAGKMPAMAGTQSGQNAVSTMTVLSPKAWDRGLSVGTNFLKASPSITIDLKDVRANAAKGLFGMSGQYGKLGDKYTVQMQRDGKWSDIGLKGKDFDTVRTAQKAGIGFFVVSAKLPDVLTVGTYKVRLYDETAKVALTTERDVVVKDTGAKKSKGDDKSPTTPDKKTSDSDKKKSSDSDTKKSSDESTKTDKTGSSKPKSDRPMSLPRTGN